MTTRIVSRPRVVIDLDLEEAFRLAHILFHYEGGNLCIVPGHGGMVLATIMDALAADSGEWAIRLRAFYHEHREHYATRSLDSYIEGHYTTETPTVAIPEATK